MKASERDPLRLILEEIIAPALLARFLAEHREVDGPDEHPRASAASRIESQPSV